MTRNGSGGSFFRGFMIGSLIGAAVALFTAPQSGERTREEIRQRGIELQKRAEATYARVQAELQSKLLDLRGRVDELSAKLDQALEQGAEALAPEAGEPSEEPAEEEAASA